MEKLFNAGIILSLLICLGSLTSCYTKCDKERDMYGTYGLTFDFLHERYGYSLLTIGENRYNNDTVNIYNEQLEPLGIHPFQDGKMNLEFLYNPLDRNEPLDTPLERTYYVYFEEGDYDTLNFNYQIGLDECSHKVLSHWSVSYNDSLYLDLTNPIYSSRYVSFIK